MLALTPHDLDLRQLRMLPFAEASSLLQDWFTLHFGCPQNRMKGHGWEKRYWNPNLRAWVEKCKYCGAIRIYQTTGNTLLLSHGIIIQRLRANSEFNQLERKVLQYLRKQKNFWE